MSEPHEPRAGLDPEAAPVRSASISPLALPRLVGGALADLRAIAEGMAVLPRLLDTLGTIQSRVEALDDEVVRMRAAVESIRGEVGGMRAAVEPLDSELAAVNERIGRLEPHLAEVSRAARPLRRVAERARGLRGGDIEP